MIVMPFRAPSRASSTHVSALFHHRPRARAARHTFSRRAPRACMNPCRCLHPSPARHAGLVETKNTPFESYPRVNRRRSQGAGASIARLRSTVLAGGTAHTCARCCVGMLSLVTLATFEHPHRPTPPTPQPARWADVSSPSPHLPLPAALLDPPLPHFSTHLLPGRAARHSAPSAATIIPSSHHPIIPTAAAGTAHKCDRAATAARLARAGATQHALTAPRRPPPRRRSTTCRGASRGRGAPCTWRASTSRAG